MRNILSIRLFVLLFCMTGIRVAVASDLEEYVIGAEDELEISFWQDPQLNTSVRVGQDGRIVIPVVGSMTAAGMKPSQLGRSIVDKISIFNKNITQASVVVVRYGSNKIYLTGQIREPGKKTFEIIPNLWDAILEAGGPTEQADLNNVTIIRGSIEKGKKISIDLPKYLNSGELSKLPPVYKGDTIFVPSRPSGGPAMQTASPLSSQNVVYIYGAVRTPGNFMITEGTSLFQALGLAGGTLESAELRKVRIISGNGDTPVVTVVDLDDNEKIASSKPIFLNPNDTVIVPARDGAAGNSFWSQFLMQVVTTSVSVTLTIVLYNVL